MKHEYILNYLDHLQPPDYFDRIFYEMTVDELIQSITELLQFDTREVVSDTCVFIRDAILLAPHSPHVQAFRNQVYESDVISHLERLVLSTHYLHRRNAAFTLGKINSVKSIPILHQAVYQLHDRDPIILPRLILEINWLERNDSFDLLTFISKSTNYIARWSLLDILSTFTSMESWKTIKQPILAALQQEAHPFLQQEALYRYNQSFFNIHHASLSRTKKQQLQKYIRTLEPEMKFEDIDLWFHNHLYEQNKRDYSIEELEQFIEVQTPKLIEQRKRYDKQHPRKKSSRAG